MPVYCCDASFFAAICGVEVTQTKKTGHKGPFYLLFLAEKASETSHVEFWQVAASLGNAWAIAPPPQPASSFAFIVNAKNPVAKTLR